MRAIIPVAGIGSRLKPHTFSTPKVLLNVGGKPIISHIIDKLLDEGINKATFVIGHLGEMIKEYIQNEYPQLNSDFIEQHNKEGLGHAIYTAIPTFDDKEVSFLAITSPLSKNGTYKINITAKDRFENALKNYPQGTGEIVSLLAEYAFSDKAQ